MDPYPRRRLFKLLFLSVVLILAGVSAFYFYERAKELRQAEDRAKSVGDRVYETRPAAVDPITGEVAPAGQ